MLDFLGERTLSNRDVLIIFCLSMAGAILANLLWQSDMEIVGIVPMQPAKPPEKKNPFSVVPVEPVSPAPENV